jgi:hypothetical protein
MVQNNLPSRFINLAGRAWNYRKNSWPYLSGDAFADMSDFQFHPPRYRKLIQKTKIEEARIIFCPSHSLENLLNLYENRINAHTIILGNSDRDFSGFDMELPASIVSVYVQNLNFDTTTFKILPIGIENLRLNYNGKLENFAPYFTATAKINKILVGPFGQSHPDRNFVSEIRETKSSILEISLGRLSPVEYAMLSSKYRFIACPRGNGIDTHRFWETLYRGGIPIVKRTSWSKHLASLNIPFIEIDKWESVELEKAVENYEALDYSPATTPELWMPYWENEMQKILLH